MKSFILFSCLVFSSLSFAAGLNYSKTGPSDEAVEAVRKKAGFVFKAMTGVNGYGTTACQVNTGKPFSQLSDAEIDASQFEFCVEVFTETKEAKAALDVLFPAGSKIENVFVNVSYIGTITTY